RISAGCRSCNTPQANEPGTSPVITAASGGSVAGSAGGGGVSGMVLLLVSVAVGPVLGSSGLWRRRCPFVLQVATRLAHRPGSEQHRHGGHRVERERSHPATCDQDSPAHRGLPTSQVVAIVGHGPEVSSSLACSVPFPA